MAACSAFAQVNQCMRAVSACNVKRHVPHIVRPFPRTLHSSPIIRPTVTLAQPSVEPTAARLAKTATLDRVCRPPCRRRLVQLPPVRT